MCSRLIFSLAAVACLTLTGCGTNKTCERTEPFQTSTTGGDLKVPEDLAKPRTARDYDIPDVAPGRNVRGPCADAPPGSIKTPPPPPDVKPPEPDADGNLPLPDSSAPPSTGPVTLPPTPPVLPQTKGDAGAPVPGSGPSADAGVSSTVAGPAARADVPVAPATPPAASGDPIADARAALDGWLAAWRAGDADAYLGFYSENFEPPIPGEPIATWRQKRRDLFAATGEVDVRLDRITIVESRPGVLRARFIQELYRGGQINALIKSLEFGRYGDRMLIDRELVLEIL